MSCELYTKDLILLLSLGGVYKIPQQIRTGCREGLIGITFQHFPGLIPTQGPTLSQAREMCGRAKEKQTQTRTEEEIPQGLSRIEEEVRQYLQCNPLQIFTRCRALKGASPLWLSASGSITQGSVHQDISDTPDGKGKR